MIKKIPPTHPGKTLLNEFLEPMKISRSYLSSAIRISPKEIDEIICGRQPVSADIALRLGLFFKMSPQFWMGLQSHYDLAVAEDESAERLAHEIQPYAAAVC